MRPFVQPPPSLHCEFCQGELRFKVIESATGVDFQIELLVCTKCGQEKSFAVNSDPYRPYSVGSRMTARPWSR